MQNNDVKKVLLINFGGIGDEILFFPTIKSVKQTYPNAKIYLALEKRSKSAYRPVQRCESAVLVLHHNDSSGFFNHLPRGCSWV